MKQTGFEGSRLCLSRTASAPSEAEAGCCVGIGRLSPGGGGGGGGGGGCG